MPSGYAAIWCRKMKGVHRPGDTIFEADLEAVMQEPVSALGLKESG